MLKAIKAGALLLLALLLTAGTAGAVITTVNNSTTAGWTAPYIISDNATKDLSSDNITRGYLYDTFSDSVLSSIYTVSGTVTESNGVITTTGAGAGITYPLSYVDNFNASVNVKTIQNGASNPNAPQFLYLFSAVANNLSSYYIQRNDVTLTNVIYKGVTTSSTGGTYDRLSYNTLKVNNSDGTTKAFRNGVLDSTLTSADLTNLKTALNLGGGLGNGAGAVIGEFDRLEYYRNNSGDVWILNRTSQNPYNIINRTRLIIYNTTNTGLMINLSARPNGSLSWITIQTNLSNYTWYSIPAAYQTNSYDFKVEIIGNTSEAPIFNALEYDETPNLNKLMIDGFVTNTIGANTSEVKVTLSNSTHTFTTFTKARAMVNNTDMCDYNHVTLVCNGTRQNATTYWANDTDIELQVFAHADTANQALAIKLYINGVLTQDTRLRPLAPTENTYTAIYTRIPQYSSYRLEILNFHHFAWFEYPYSYGYYAFNSINAGSYTLLFQHPGYDNLTESISITNTTRESVTIQPSSSTGSAGVIVSTPGFNGIGLIFILLITIYLNRRLRKC